MADHLQIRQWVRTNQEAYTTILLAEGQYIAVGTEQGIEIFDVTGRQRLVYPSVGGPLPILQLAIAQQDEGEKDTIGPLYAATRPGHLIRLNLERDSEGEQFHPQGQSLYESPNDLHTLSAAHNLLAVGHLGPGLALLDDEGCLLWRRHPDDGTATQGKVWSVDLDDQGTTLYAGSASKETNWLVALDARSQAPRAHRRLEKEQRATAIAALPQDQGVAVALSAEMSFGRVVVYDLDLEPAWERSFDELVTALAVDPQKSLVAVGIGYAGEVIVMDAHDGNILASGLYLRTLINDLDMRQGQILAAATQDGQMALIHYQSEEFRL